MFEGKKVFLFNHPLINHKITKLCDKTTPSKEFNEIAGEIASLMAYEVLKDVKCKNVRIDAPISSFDSPVLAQDIVIVPILRAGLGMVPGLRDLIPTARVGHIGLYRNEETLEPVEYYCKLPQNTIDPVVLVVDPALATGGSGSAAIQFIKNRGFKNIKFLALIGVEEGINKIAFDHPDVEIYVAHFAEGKLNEHGYIVTAFGDAGDRVFGTFQ